MTPQELDAWIKRHGDIDHETTSIAGQRIVFTKDGSRVVLTQLTPDSLRVDDIFEKDAPAAAAASDTGGPVAPSATPAASGGTTISRADLEAKARGNPSLVYQGQKIVDKTITEYGIQKTVRVPVVTWIDRKTGYTLTAEVGPGGETYTVTYDGIDEKNKDDAAKDKTPTTVATSTTEPYIVTRNPDGTLTTSPNPNYLGPKPEKGTNHFIVGGDGKTYIIPVDGNGVAGKPIDSGLPAKPEEGKTYQVQTPTGTQIVEIKGGKPTVVYTVPKGEEILQGRGPNGEDVRVIRGEKGEVVRYEPIPGSKTGKVKLPPGAPELDLSSPERARQTFNDLFIFVDRAVRNGDLTPEQGKDILAGPHQAVGNVLDAAKEQRVTEENRRRDALTERSQDMTQAGNRLSFAQGTAGTAIKQSADLIKAAEGGESTIVPLMVLQAGMGQALGGFRESPNTVLGVPTVAQRAGAPFTAAASSLANPAAAGQPNQLGVGGTPPFMTPTGPAVTPDPAGAEAIRQQIQATAAATSANAGRLATPPGAAPAIPPGAATAAPPTTPARPAAAPPLIEPPSRGAIPSMAPPPDTSTWRGGGSPPPMKQEAPASVPPMPPDRMPEPAAPEPAQEPMETRYNWVTGEYRTRTKAEWDAWLQQNPLHQHIWQEQSATTYRETPPLPPGEITRAPSSDSSPWASLGGPPAFYRTGMQTDRTPDDIANDLIAKGEDPRLVRAAQQQFMRRLGAA